MEKRNFIGIDVGKQSLEVSVCNAENEVFHCTMENTPIGIRKGFKELAKTSGTKPTTCCVIMEYTGIYTFHLINYLTETGIEFFVAPAIEVKRSSGLTRGKSDKADSYRLAQFAFQKYSSLKPFAPVRKVISELSVLVSLRSRLLKSKKALETALKESSGFMEKPLVKDLSSLQKSTINALSKDQKKVDKRIAELIDQDEHLSKMMKQITSVDGIGKVTAVQMIITTNEFKNIRDPKKFACYAGVAPFEHTSGTSIRGKTRVSHLANKTMKSLLHMAALSSIKMNGELKDYFLRKVNEGKNKMSVLNAVRNKLILRIFAVVNQNKIYQKTLV